MDLPSTMMGKTVGWSRCLCVWRGEFRLRQVSLRCLLGIQVVMSEERWMYELEFEELLGL